MALSQHEAVGVRGPPARDRWTVGKSTDEEARQRGQLVPSALLVPELSKR